MIDLRSIRPLDIDTIVESVRRTGKTAYRARGAEVRRFRRRDHGPGMRGQAFEWLDAPIRRVTAIDTPVPYAPTLEDYYLPQTEDIVAAARWLLAY